MSIHAFVQKDGNRKQFPLAFSLMSRKQKNDYVEVTYLCSPKMIFDFQIAEFRSVYSLNLVFIILTRIFNHELCDL